MFQWHLPFPMLLLLYSRYTLSGHRGWNQDSNQADDTLTRSRVPCQHHRHEGLRREWTCLRNVHHRCRAHLQLYILFMTQQLEKYFYLGNCSGRCTGFGASEASFLACSQSLMGSGTLTSSLTSLGLHVLGSCGRKSAGLRVTMTWVEISSLPVLGTWVVSSSL